MREITRTQISFADLEVGRRVRLEPLLQQISDFLDRHGELVTAVHRDLSRSLKHARRGRRGLNAEQVLRSFVLMRTKNWDYRELAERIADGFTLRQFTRFDSAPVPRHHAFHHAFMRLQAATLRRINEAIVAAAVRVGLEDVDKLRLDTTVVETDIRYPRDSGLLWDTVRVLSRLVEHIGDLAPAACATFPRRTRRAKRRMQEIGRMRERAQRARSLARKYRDLITVTTEVIEKAEAVTRKARTVRCTELLDTLKLKALCDEVTQVAALGRRVIDQSERRIFHGETVPADQKLYSLFEPHTDMIKRGKVYKPVEFGTTRCCSLKAASVSSPITRCSTATPSIATSSYRPCSVTKNDSARPPAFWPATAASMTRPAARKCTAAASRSWRSPSGAASAVSNRSSLRRVAPSSRRRRFVRASRAGSRCSFVAAA